MKKVFTKPLNSTREVELLDYWRRGYWDADLELPHDFNTPDGGVESCVAFKDGKMLGSLTGIKAVVLDPFIHDPDADPLDLMMALTKMETVLTHNAQKWGAMDSYIAIPEQLTKYRRIVESFGYQPTVQKCIVYRRPLVPETVPLLGEERDRQMAGIPATGGDRATDEPETVK